MKALLVLEDGSTFEGESVGAQGETIGEVVFNTAVVGHQELMTDPANAGKILVFTYPLIGNYGVAKKFTESAKCWTSAVVMKEGSRIHSNRQAEEGIRDFLKKEGRIAVSGVDTRALAARIREKGEMSGIVSTRKPTRAALLKKLRERDKNARTNLIQEISVKKARAIQGAPGGHRIAVLDLGVTNGCLKQLKDLDCAITLLPYDTDTEKIVGSQFDGVIVSSGPENDAAIPRVVETAGELIGEEMPLLGIGVGHHVISLAIGGRLKKLKTGHRGLNYPAKSDYHYTGKMTVQNHSYVVDEESLKSEEGLDITLRNVNDDTVEEMVSQRLKFITAQYCPVSPGRDEVNDVFTRFLRMIDKSV